MATARTIALSVLLLSLCAHGWWGGGHRILTVAAMKSLSADLPAFFRDGGVAVAHASLDPDIVKHRSTPSARAREHPEHYMDLELLGGADLPPERAAFVQLCCSLGVAPESVGFLPYAIAEWTERLAVYFAEHRAWPENESVRGRCLFSAGLLAHYVQDLCQPLHLTVHFDGRAGPDGKSPRSGIHAKVDGLVENLKLAPSGLAKGQKGAPFDSLVPAVMSELRSNRVLIDTVYAMKEHLPDSAGGKVSARVVSFATQRARRAADLTADFFATAWSLSESITFEKWLDRDAMDAASKRELAAPRKERGR